jgi:hypothetical protein
MSHTRIHFKYQNYDNWCAVTLLQVLLAWRKSQALSNVRIWWGLIPAAAQGRRSSKFKVFVQLLHPYITPRTASCAGPKVCMMPLDQHRNVRTSSAVRFDEVTHSLKPSDLLSQYSQNNIHAHTEVQTCYPGIQRACFVGLNTLTTNSLYTLIPLASRSKAWVCDTLLAGIVVSVPAVGMNVSCECCVLSDRGLCVGLITRPE